MSDLRIIAWCGRCRTVLYNGPSVIELELYTAVHDCEGDEEVRP